MPFCVQSNNVCPLCDSFCNVILMSSDNLASFDLYAASLTVLHNLGCAWAQFASTGRVVSPAIAEMVRAGDACRTNNMMYRTAHSSTALIALCSEKSVVVLVLPVA
eukprot:4417178-Amphidinium_carterae.1